MKKPAIFLPLVLLVAALCTQAQQTPLTITGLQVADKTYDGTLTATIITHTYTLVEPQAQGHDVRLDFGAAWASFGEAGVGPDRKVFVYGLRLSGEDAHLYSINGPPLPPTHGRGDDAIPHDYTTTAGITPKELQLGGSFTANDKVYDGTQAATLLESELTLLGVVDPDVVEAGVVTLAFSHARAGSHISVDILSATLTGPDAGNYTLSVEGAPTATAGITPKELHLGGSFTAADKVYDGTLATTLLESELTLLGVVDPDVVEPGVVSLAFSHDAVGSHISVNILSATLTGPDADNYALSVEGAPTATAGITPKELTIGGSFTAMDKVIDESPGASFESNDLVLLGLVPKDADAVELSGLQIAFAGISVGTHTVSITAASLDGPAKGNYSLSLAGAPVSSASILHGPPARLAIHTQPSPAATRDEAFVTQPVIHILDAFGNLATSDMETIVTASLHSGTGELLGTRSVSASGGVASFGNLAHGIAEIIAIAFDSEPVTETVVSQEIRVLFPEEPNQLHIHLQASATSVAGEAFGQQPIIHILDHYGGHYTGDNETIVTASLLSGSGELIGVRSVTAAAGVASFGDLGHATAESITIEFTAMPALLPATSEQILVTPRPLVVTVEPASRIYGAADPPFAFADFSPQLMPGDQPADLTGGDGTADALVFTTMSNQASHAGIYEGDIGILTQSFTGHRAASYDIHIVRGQLEITKKDLQVTAVAPGIAYGDPPPAVALVFDGFVNDDTEDDLANTGFILGTTYQLHDPVGSYQTTIAMGTAQDVNYHFHPLLTSGFEVGQRSLTVSGAYALDKAYDGSTHASIAGAILQGVIPGDEVALDALEGSFADPNTALNIEVLATLTLTGDAAPNYSLIQPQGLTADIFPRTLTLGGSFSAHDKAYDGTTHASLHSEQLILQQVVPGEEELLGVGVLSLSFASPAVGTHTVSITQGSLSGPGSHNYLLSTQGAPTTTARIDPGPPAALHIHLEPAEQAGAGQAFDPQPIIHITDAHGHLVTDAEPTLITASVHDGDGELTGQREVTTQDGVARFDDLAHTVAGSLRIGFEAGGTTWSVISHEITIDAGWPATITLTQSPQPQVYAGLAMEPAPTVAVADAYGNPVPGAEVHAQTNRYHFCIHCKAVVSTNTEGVAVFSNLVINIAHSDYLIHFSVAGDGGSLLESKAFALQVKPGWPASASIIRGPTTVRPNLISDRYTLTITDEFDNPSSSPERLIFSMSSTATPGHFSFYADAGGSEPTQQIFIRAGESFTHFWYRDNDLFSKGDVEIGTRTITSSLTDVVPEPGKATPAGPHAGHPSIPADDLPHQLDPATYLVDVTDHWVWIARQEALSEQVEAHDENWLNSDNWNHLEGLPGEGETVIIKHQHTDIPPRISAAHVHVATILIDCPETILGIAPGAALTTDNLVLMDAAPRPIVHLEADEEGQTASFILQQGGVQGRIDMPLDGPDGAWQQFAAPLINQSISGEKAGNTGKDFADQVPFFTWFEPAQQWVSYHNQSVWPTWEVANRNPGEFIPRKGYLAAYPGRSSLRFEGELLYSPEDAPNTTVLRREAHASDPYVGFNLMGNPYPASIDWKAPGDWPGQEQLASPVVWTWDAGIGQYGSYHPDSKSDKGNNQASRFIAPMQAFWVRAGQHGQPLTIRAGARTHTFNTSEKQATHGECPDVLRLLLDVDGQQYRDEVVIEFGHAPGSGPGAEKLFSLLPQAPSLFVRKQEKNYGISFNGSQPGEIIALHLLAGTPGLHQLHFTGGDRFPGLILEDRLQQRMHKVSSGPYAFHACPHDPADRFLLHTGHPTHAGELQEKSPPLLYSHGPAVYVSTPNHSYLILYDATGRIAFQQGVPDAGLQRYVPGVPPGAYVGGLYGQGQAVHLRLMLSR